MRTPKTLYPNERIIYKPELSACPHCGGPLVLYNYLSWDKVVQTLDQVLSIASRPGHCATASCPGHTTPLLSAAGQQIALPGTTYGHDVIARIGWQRQVRRDIYADIHADLAARIQISESQVRYLYQQVYLPLLACRERQHADRLTQVVQHYGGLLLALDGLAPTGGEAQLWFIRELTSGVTLRSGWLSRFDQATFEAFLAPLTQLPGPILAVLSDKQNGLLPAVATVFPSARHHFCHTHYLRNLAEPWAERDAAFNVALRKAVRQEVGVLLRTERPSTTTATNVLTVTGLLPDAPAAPATDDADRTAAASSLTAETRPTDAVVTQLCQHTRYLLTLKGRPPFRLAGLETYQRLHKVVTFSAELLAYHDDPRLAQLHRGLRTALAPFATQYQDLCQGATWLQGIAHSLQPAADHPTTSTQVAQRLRSYLDDLLHSPDSVPHLDAFRLHLDTVSRSYWSGLFHCYDVAHLPRTNNALESHFRDTLRRLLRTSGQQSLTRRTLQRTGAWELLPQCATESATQEALRHIRPVQLAQEQQRLRHHWARFRLHSRSGRRIAAQFDVLRQQWRAIAATSSG
jgi:hypothetical protein